MVSSCCVVADATGKINTVCGSGSNALRGKGTVQFITLHHASTTSKPQLTHTIH